jgi:hypothetical protein
MGDGAGACVTDRRGGGRHAQVIPGHGAPTTIGFEREHNFTLPALDGAETGEDGDAASDQRGRPRLSPPTLAAAPCCSCAAAPAHHL